MFVVVCIHEFYKINFKNIQFFDRISKFLKLNDFNKHRRTQLHKMYNNTIKNTVSNLFLQSFCFKTLCNTHKCQNFHGNTIEIEF